MRYILRQTIHASAWQRQLKEIIELAKRVPIEEIMLMEQSHQIVMVPYTLEKHQEMAAIYAEMGKVFKENGLDYSVNIATIVGHSDAPIAAKDVLPYQKFVGEDLKERHAIYCIGDPAWQDYAAQVVKLYAKTHPKRIMIDDDFRSLNHSQQFGCFCDLHIHALKEQLALPSSFKALNLVESLLSSNDDSLAYKQAWQNINFNYQCEAAQKIEKAIHLIDPSIEVGLMNSGEQAHSLQGRDMAKLLQLFAGENRKALSRPAGGVYADELHGQIINMHQMPALSVEAARIDTTWVSEVENWPHSRYLKSLHITALQMMMHALAGMDALTLNIYDYLATPIALEPTFESMLKTLKPQLKQLQMLRKGKQLKGVSLPWRWNYAAHHTNRSHAFNDLYPRRPLDLLLPQMGIPTQFSPSSVNVLLGDEVRAYSDSEIKQFLSQALFLDNVAAEHLIERGFQAQLGIKMTGKITQACVERLSHPEFSGLYHNCDLPTNWFRMDVQGDHISHVEVDPSALVIAHFVDQDRNIIAPSFTLFENELGGKLAIIAQAVQDLAFFHRAKSIQMQAVLKWLGLNHTAFWIEDHVNIAPFIYEDEKQGLYVLVNTGLDEETLHLPKGLKSVFGHPVDELSLKALEIAVYTYEVDA
jgi:hypothetical protein